jgi:16S rRNA G966 N2-methylase RsmD
MYMKFSKDLFAQEIYAQGNELVGLLAKDKDEQGNRLYSKPDTEMQHVLTIDYPVLVTDNYKIGQLNSTLRDTVFALFSSPIKTVEYDGTIIAFEQRKYPQVWGPSIDTLLMAKFLTPEYLANVETVAEFGCGSGFLSMRAIQNAKNLKKITIIDINKYAIQCAKDHINDERAEFINGDAIKSVEGRKFDLIICNPPYIPRPKSIDDNAYEGIGLLAETILQTKNLLNDNGRFLTNISSLSDSVIKPVIADTGVHYKLLGKRFVPLKVYNVLNNPDWMNYLLNEKGLKKESHEGYDFWHNIKITEIRKD